MPGMATWYYAKDGEPCGPIDEREIVARLWEGALSDDDLLWTAGMPGWAPASEAFPESKRKETPGLATASFIIGLVGAMGLGFGIAGIPAVICGHMALARIRNDTCGRYTGRGLALSGLWLGYSQMVLAALLLLSVALLLASMATLWS